METRDVMIKRLSMRSMRRGIKEMDLILSDFASQSLTAMDEADLTLYDKLLSENDHDLFSWTNGQSAPPELYSGLIKSIQDGAFGLTRPN